MDMLSILLPCFFTSAVIVIVAGRALATSADELAKQTRWGALWVGAMLVSVVTSLPELTANATSVLIGSPTLALGNIFGSNMVNMFILSSVALFFGWTKIFQGHGSDAKTLSIAAVAIGSIATIASITGDIQVGVFSAGSILIAGAYLIGLQAIRKANRDGVSIKASIPIASIRGPGLKFAIASLCIIAAAIVLATSANGIAKATGIGSSFMGVFAMAIITSLPEASVTISAMLRRSYSLAIATLYGSCCFNLAIIPIIDTLTGTAVIRAASPEHIIASVTGTIFMAVGAGLLLNSERLPRAIALVSLFLTIATYPIAIMWIFSLSVS
jgi:cation:H+ antiporter